MADKSRIEWTDATWNPVTGCTKVSAGCKHCYAERDWARLSANKATRYYGRKFTDVQCHLDVLELPLRWTKPRRVFVNSMSDLFHPDVPNNFIRQVFSVMATESHHTFQVLTKRADRMCEMMNMWRDDDVFMHHNGQVPGNIWLGVSIEDQATADERIPLLLKTPAALRWVSAEPLLGPVRLNLATACDRQCSEFQNAECPGSRGLCAMQNALDWVVVGGESGPKARPMHPEWVRSLRDQCATAGVPLLFKQWGEFAPGEHVEKAWYSLWREFPVGSNEARRLRLHGDEATQEVQLVARVGKKAAGRLLDGVLHDEYPEVRS